MPGMHLYGRSKPPEDRAMRTRDDLPLAAHLALALLCYYVWRSEDWDAKYDSRDFDKIKGFRIGAYLCPDQEIRVLENEPPEENWWLHVAGTDDGEYSRIVTALTRTIPNNSSRTWIMMLDADGKNHA